MKHNLTISVSKDPRRGGVLQCRSVSVREKFLTWMFGRTQKLMILVPGNSVSTVTINEVQEGGDIK